MTTTIIFLPLAGAIIVGVLPVARRVTEALALLVALGVAVLGAIALVGFHISGGLQYVQNTGWISDFGAGASVRYHVGMDGPFSAWVGWLPSMRQESHTSYPCLFATMPNWTW